MEVLYIYLIVVFVMSLTSFILFCVDKSKAIKGTERIKEKNLMFFTVCGGAIGSQLGRLISHHKTGKGYFSIVIKASIFFQVIAAIILTIFKLI